MRAIALLALVVEGFVAAPQPAAAYGAGDADAMYAAYNNAFLKTNNGQTYYAKALNDSSADGTWTLDLDLFATQDAYERTGDPNIKSLVEDLLSTFQSNNPAPNSWDGYNDDLGWDSLGLIRAYMITGDAALLAAAQDTFEFAYARGWDTAHNGGGIWEQQPDPSDPGVANKCALSENSLGKVACKIYQSTHNTTYLNLCTQLFDWSVTVLYDADTGNVGGCVDQDGSVDGGSNGNGTAYNLGTFADYANLVWEITGDQNAYNIAEKVIDFTKASATVNGIFSKNDNGVNTWADDVGRAVGHFSLDNQQWDKYYSWMVQNANSILANRRPDLNLTWNQWDTPTPEDNTQLCNWLVSAVAWLQATPPIQPNNIGGLHTIVNNQTGMAIDSLGEYGLGNSVNQWVVTNGSLNQRWQLTQNSDTSWNVVNTDTWLALDCPGGNNASNIGMIQWQSDRSTNQRWWIDQQPNGNYKIWNQESLLALDGASNSTNGAAIIQRPWNSTASQQWILQ